MRNDGKKFTMNSLITKIPTKTIQSATNCFRLGRTINQFRRLCLPSMQYLSSVEGSEPTYISINSLNTNEDDDVLDKLPEDGSAIIYDDEDNLKCAVKLNTGNHRLCRAKEEHDAILGKIDAYLAKKTLIATEAPHLDTEALIAKLDGVAKTVDLDVSTILAEQIKKPVLGTARSWIRKGSSPKPKTLEFQHLKGFLRYHQEFDRLLIKEEGQLPF